MTDKRPIGIFDSGLGGLTVLEAVHKVMPHEDLIYFGDSGRAPYGTKSAETVRKYTFQDINFLLSHDVKMIVIACNTASACSLSAVKESYEWLPVQEVVGPGSAAAVKTTKNGKIGVIGTTATISSGVYERAIGAICPDANVFSKSCPLFVPLVEEGWWTGPVPERVAKEYLKELKKQKIDTLILGCTHYPYLEKIISEYMGEGVSIINSGRVVAESIKNSLKETDMLRGGRSEGKIRYFTSDSVTKFASLGKIFLKETLSPVEHADIESVSVAPRGKNG